MLRLTAVLVLTCGAWLVYLSCRTVLVEFDLPIAGTDLDKVALSFLGAVVYLGVLGSFTWQHWRQ